MSDNRQLHYFSLLGRLGMNKEIFITLAEVAELMYTSTRHCRTLLKQMNEAGWIKWTPKAGRNQRSCLYIVYSIVQVKSELAQQLISKGKYEKALELINNDQSLFAQLLKSTSGTQRRHGRLHVQLTYDRVFSPLLPHTQLRNSERFLLRQVYSTLTLCGDSGELKPDLAHHWNYDDVRCSWKFYLRPHLRFHDGSDITAKVVVELFNKLKRLPLYNKELAHVDKVAEVTPLCVEFTLSESDSEFAALLSDIKYSIQPPVQLAGTLSIVGSGIFQVQEVNTQKLTLQAYDSYHGYCALADTVTIWQLPDQSHSAFADTRLEAGMVPPTQSMCANYLSLEGSHSNVSNGSKGDLRSRIEEGCLLALVNHKANLSLPERKYLSQVMSTERLLAALTGLENKVEAEPAYNLLPSWIKISPTEIEAQPLPDNLTIATFNHNALKLCAEALAILLQQEGVQCSTTEYSFDDFYALASQNKLNEDIILTSMNLDDNQPVSAFCWMLSNPVLHQSLSQSDGVWLTEKLYMVRKQSSIFSYMSELESIASALISSHYLIPMFHHRQTLHFEDVLRSVSINVWGWPEIRDVWTDE